MPIDFHDPSNHATYASRIADTGWSETMRAIVDPRDTAVADIGCGGGIYSRAWSDLGARSVIGVDFSRQMVEDARDSGTRYPNLSFQQGDATATGLPDASVDIVFERALIHHLPDLEVAFAEARRILKPGGHLIVQDRTMEDVMRPPSPEHVRGFFFQVFPRLIEVERERRPDRKTVEAAMSRAGFADVSTMSLLERRRTYESAGELEADLRARTGRSILHELADDELDRLIDAVLAETHGAFPLNEVDSWTVWSARAPA